MLAFFALQASTIDEMLARTIGVDEDEDGPVGGRVGVCLHGPASFPACLQHALSASLQLALVLPQQRSARWSSQPTMPSYHVCLISCACALGLHAQDHATLGISVAGHRAGGSGGSSVSRDIEAQPLLSRGAAAGGKDL